MSRSVLGALAIASLPLLSVATDAHAQTRLGVHAGLNLESSDLFIGGNSHFAVQVAERDLWGNVGLEIYPFADGFFLTRINANGLFPFASTAGAEFYGGGGLVMGLMSFDDERLDNDTDFGINAVAGALLSGQDKNYRPFIEVNQTIGGGTDFSVRGGILFKLDR